ncbi:MAG TPA: SDR family oxidoreductase [Bacteroidia bacterium]|nr:SDR family oxidoreductase [Bacteroidia bacterium]
MNIIVTGASRGIGFELVKQFLSAGHTVFCLTRNIEPLKDIAYPNLKSISTDLTSQDSMNEAVAFIKKEATHIDCIINNAGSLINKPYESISYDELQKVYQVNVFAPYYLIQQLLPVLGKHSKTHVVNISSMGGFQGSSKFPGLTAYSSSKSAIAGLTECLAEELKEKNISVNCLAIGAVQTEMLAEAFPGYQAPLSPKQMAEYIFDFALKGHQYYNGKILPVSSSTP